MYLKKSSWIITGISFLFSLLWLVIRKSFSFASLSDSLFLFTLFFVIIGVFLKVFASGFFDNFQRSFKKREKREKNPTAKTEYMKLSEVGRSSFRFWLEPAVMLFILSLVALILSTFIK